MSDYYNSRRKKNLFDPGSKEPFKISRSKIDLFVDCPLCFYLDRRLGVARPPGFPFALNSAVDLLLKKEFDIHRAEKTAHPLMDSYGIEAVPFQHKDMDIWRENFKGITFLHQPTNFLITGAVDDVWVDKNGQLMIVDYKATSKESEINLDALWQKSYKRQMEVYQWLFRQNGFEVSDTGYFVYANGRRDKEAFDGKLEFDITVIPYEGNTNWIEKTLSEMKKCLLSERAPEAASSCDFCAYFEGRKAVSPVVEERKKAEEKEKDSSPPKLF